MRATGRYLSRHHAGCRRTFSMRWGHFHFACDCFGIDDDWQAWLSLPAISLSTALSAFPNAPLILPSLLEKTWPDRFHYRAISSSFFYIWHYWLARFLSFLSLSFIAHIGLRPRRMILFRLASRYEFPDCVKPILSLHLLISLSNIFIAMPYYTHFQLPLAKYLPLLNALIQADFLFFRALWFGLI